jgi:hypothetical protein
MLQYHDRNAASSPDNALQKIDTVGTRIVKVKILQLQAILEMDNRSGNMSIMGLKMAIK